MQYRYFDFFFFISKGSSRKRPRLEKGQESMDTDMKKEDDLKSEPKGNKITPLYSEFPTFACKFFGNINCI